MAGMTPARRRTPATPADERTPGAASFYRHVLGTLQACGVPFLVGGGHALVAHTGVVRRTRDLDLFLRRTDYPRAAGALEQAGYETELTHPHWLGKVRRRRLAVDLIFSSGNGLGEVDDRWFEHAVPARVLGVPVPLVPVEEMLWSKLFVMERERYDGADVAHLLQACADRLDWSRLLERVGPHWRVLLSHLVLFGFVYPADRERIPRTVLEDLLGRLRAEMDAPAPAGRVCHGTLLSREQYLHDLERRGLRDARLPPIGAMTEREVGTWTDAIRNRPD